MRWLCIVSEPCSLITNIVAGLVCIIGLLAGSFANSLGALVFTQGIMYGLGLLIFYYPILAFVNEYWIARRGTAYGLLCSASSLSGAIMPFIVEGLLNKYGSGTTLRAIAIGMVVVTGPFIPVSKGRLLQLQMLSQGELTGHFSTHLSSGSTPSPIWYRLWATSSHLSICLPMLLP